MKFIVYHLGLLDTTISYTGIAYPLVLFDTVMARKESKGGLSSLVGKRSMKKD